MADLKFVFSFMEEILCYVILWTDMDVFILILLFQFL